MIPDKADSHGDGETLSGLGYIWKIEATGFASGLHLRYEKEENQV